MSGRIRTPDLPARRTSDGVIGFVSGGSTLGMPKRRTVTTRGMSARRSGEAAVGRAVRRDVGKAWRNVSHR